jgi:hypothetical protein
MAIEGADGFKTFKGVLDWGETEGSKGGSEAGALARLYGEV